MIGLKLMGLIALVLWEYFEWQETGSIGALTWLVLIAAGFLGIVFLYQTYPSILSLGILAAIIYSAVQSYRDDTPTQACKSA